MRKQREEIMEILVIYLVKYFPVKFRSLVCVSFG
jgi:hypothetical protein